MALRVNMSNVGSEFELIESDRYLMRQAKAEIKTSKPKPDAPKGAKPGKYLNVEFHFDPDVIEANPSLKNRRLWRTFGCTPNSLWAVEEYLAKVGYPQDELDADEGADPNDLDPDELAAAVKAMFDQVNNAPIYVNVVVENYDKKMPNGTIESKQRNAIDSFESVAEVEA